LVRDCFRGSKLLDELCQICLSEPSSTVQTISRAIKEIMLRLQFGLELCIYIFSVINGMSVNLFGCVKIGETFFSLCIIDSIQYKDSFMLLEACVKVIGLPILQGFHVKQGDIYVNNY